METTQKNREETRRMAPVMQETAPPPSAQQNNGAARTAEEQQRAASAAPRQSTAQPRSASAPRQAAPARKSAPPRKPAPKKQAEPKKKTSKKLVSDDLSTGKKRAYGNSKPKKNAATAVNDIFRKSAERQAEKKAKQPKKKKNRPKQPTPAVIYTQPAAFNRNRLLIQLFTVTAVVVALVLGLSVFFKVETITVSGAQVYTEWAIKEASGISEGDNLLTFSHARSAALIKANLPYVDTVRFGINLPDTVNIIVEEDDVVYAIQDQNGTWWLMNSDGRVVEMGNNSKASGHTQILGVTLDNPVPDEKGIATESVPTETDANGELLPVTLTGAQKLNVVLQILKALEENGIVGEIASVDVNRLEDIILWYGSRYQVNLGDTSRLEYKIACMNDVILQMSEWQSGILDISFNIWTGQVGYTPFA